MGEVMSERWSVAGMTCGGCAASVVRVLSGVSGVLDVRADHATGSVVLQIESSIVDRSEVRRRIEQAGFSVEDA